MTAKHPTPDINLLATRERILLFCTGRRTSWQRAGITTEVVIALIVRGLVVRDERGHLALTDDGGACAAGAVVGVVRAVGLSKVLRYRA